MDLEFATIINNKPTYFVEKIWSGLIDMKHDLQDPENTSEVFFDYGEYLVEYRKNFKDPNQTVFNEDLQNIFPKIHTIRKDEEEKFTVGQEFNPVIKTRNGEFYQFAPALKVTAIDIICIAYVHGEDCFPLVTIHSYDNSTFIKLSPIHHFNYITELDKIAKNSGFNEIKDFLRFFNKTGVRKIIHWTNFKYV